MAGYTRQSTADIIPTATVRAAPLNAEYNAIRDAFAASGGHKHDGTAAEGEYVPLISDLDNYNKVVIDSTNNRVGVFVEVSAAAVEQVRFQDGAIVPVTTNDIDLGTSLLKFKNLYIEGTATIGDVSLAGGTIDDTVIGGTTPAAGTFTTLTATTVDLNGGNIDGTVIGATTAAAADFTTMDASGNATVGGTFGVTGNTTIGGTLGVTGVTTLGTANITSVDLNSGAIDGTTIGAATPAAGTFTVLTANTSLTAATADINGGTLDGVTIGGTVSAAATVTNLTATGTSTLSTVDINAGAIDGTTIGATSHTTGKFTTLQSTGLATLNSVNIDGGNIDGTVIGSTSAAAITGTTITGTSFVGPVTGNVTGNLTGNVTGNVTGDVTGNITSSGSSSFNNVTIDGTLNMNAGTTATITNLTSPTNTNDAATKGYVDTSISNLVDSAPGTLDTLNELAAALGDDPNFSTTITNSIATKLPLAGGTMTGAIAMSTNKITGLGDPTAAQDAMTKAYADSNYLALSGGTMTGAIDMGSAKITTTYTPTNAADLTTKTYVDGILGSATAAAASAAAAATSETNAATSESNAATSESNAAASATSAATLYDNFDDRYLGAKASAPTVDNDGDALITGALYFNTTTNIMNVYGSSGWQSAGSAVNGTSDRVTYTATAGQTVFAATYDAGYVDVYMNGVKLLAGTDFTATNGTSIQLASGAAVNDIIDIVAYGTFVLADHYSKTQSDARYVEVAGDTMTGNLDVQGTVTADGLTVESSDPVILQHSATGPTLRFNNIDQTVADGQQLARLEFSTDDAGIEKDEAYLQLTADGNAGAAFFDIMTGDGAPTKTARFSNNGDISFYEDTGTTAKFFWDASEESLTIGPASSTVGNLLLTTSGTTEYSNLFLENSTSYQLGTGGSSTGDYANKFYIYDSTAGAPRLSLDNSGKFGLGTMNPSYPLTLYKTDSGQTQVQFQNSTTGSAVGDGFGVGMDTNEEGFLWNYDSNDIYIGGTASGVAIRVNGSNGNVGLGAESENYYSNELVIACDDEGGMTFAGGAAHENYIMWADGTTGLDQYRGYIGYDHANNWMRFGTNGTEKMVIDTNGRVGIGLRTQGDYYAKELVVGGGANAGITIADTVGNNTQYLMFADGTSGSDQYRGYIEYAHSNDQMAIASYGDMKFYTWNGSNTITNRISLTADGLTFNGDTAAANALDDYEEGFWTITSAGYISNPSIVRGNYYTKIGNMVYVNAEFVVPANSSSSQAYFGGLPYATENGVTYRDVGSVAGNVPLNLVTYVLNNTTNVGIFENDFSGVTYSQLSNKTIVVNFCYKTPS